MICIKCRESEVDYRLSKKCSSCRTKTKGYKDPIYFWATSWLRRARTRDRNKNKEINLDIKYLIYKLKQAIKKFPELSFDSYINYPSIDRINSNRGYVKGNIQIIPRWLNLAKSSGTQKEIDEAIKTYYESHLKDTAA